LRTVDAGLSIITKEDCNEACFEQRMEDLLPGTQVPRLRALPGLLEGRARRQTVSAA